MIKDKDIINENNRMVAIKEVNREKITAISTFALEGG